MDRTAVWTARFFGLEGFYGVDYWIYGKRGGGQHLECVDWHGDCQSKQGARKYVYGRSAASFLVFTLLYTPCVAAIAAVKREMGSGMRAFLVVVLQCAVAWLMAFAVYQIGGIFF